MHPDTLTEQVQAKYAAVARSGLSSDHQGVRAVAQAFGYTSEELAALPAEANMGLSCGNPVATAHLTPGEVVADLGCGGGIDVLLASLRVGPTGKAIGIDMTPDMIERAQRNAIQFGQGTAPTNVAFYLARIDNLPLSDCSVDCLTSNCVINLTTDKPVVFSEMFRVLKPGGRVAISDIALKRPLPPEVGKNILACIGCIAGAILIEDYERMLREAGFAVVQIVDTKKDLNAYAQVDSNGCCAGSAVNSPGLEMAECCASATGITALELHSQLTRLLARFDVNAYAASVNVYAVKK